MTILKLYFTRGDERNCVARFRCRDRREAVSRGQLECAKRGPGYTFTIREP